MHSSSLLYLSFLALVDAAFALPAPLDSESCVVERDDTNDTAGYSYDTLPVGITVVSNNASVGFLQDTTGQPTLQAPQPADVVPDDAAHYQPSSPIMDMKDFRIWHDNVKDKNLGGSQKWMVVAAGTYEFSKGTGFPLDWNNNMAFDGFTGWTLDLRGCTFVEIRIDGDKNYSDQMLYINNSDDFTILGGTFWMNQGVEMFSQAKIVQVDPSPGGGDDGHVTATLQVDEGYNVTTWGEAHAPGEYNCVDTSEGYHYYRAGCNFWYQDGLKAIGNNQFQSGYASRAGIKLGQTLTIKSGPSSAASASMECNGGVHFKGMTSNAVYFNYGIGPTCTTRPLIIEDCLITNLPAFKGFAPRVDGPTMSYGNYGSAIFQADGMPDIDFRNSYWQYTGAPSDLTSMANYQPPDEATRPL